jgi:Phosphotransferase enzyme family
MIEVEAGAEVSRFWQAWEQPEAQAELDRVFRTERPRSAPPPQLRVLKLHKNCCTFEVSLDLGSGWQSVIGKVHDVDRSDISVAMQAIVDAGFGATAEFAIPRVLAYVPALHILLEEKIQGTEAKDVLVKGNPDERLAAARRCGAWLARFHAAAPPQGHVAHPDELVPRLRRWARQVKGMGGPLAIKAELLLRKLEAKIPTAGRVAPCAGHGSFIPEHVLLSGNRTVTIDLDEYDVADPARDVSWFVVSLGRLGLKKWGSLRVHDRSIEAFLDAYAAGAPPGGLTHLPFYKAMECLHRALRDVSKRNPPIPEWSNLMLDEGLSAL